jgi:outer membrane protein assembly factor BamB
MTTAHAVTSDVEGLPITAGSRRMTESSMNADAATATQPKTLDAARPAAIKPMWLARIWRLGAWLALVSVGMAVYWFSDAPRDYKNTGVVVALILATLGTSFWLFRNVSGAWKWFLALGVWTPLLAVSPFGPILIEHNGNVGLVGWRWRWAPNADELLGSVQTAGGAIEWQATPHDYPAFLGGRPWAEVDVSLDADWQQRQPKLLWRQPIGAGWSSFAIVGNYAVTQEQRGAEELVVCYELKTGKVAWKHGDNVRWDPGGSGALGKIGPRATPVAHDGRVFSHGATGIFNSLDAATGELLWSHDTLAEENGQNVMWGKACSPLIVDNLVVVSVGALGGNSLVAYDQKTGRKVWHGGDRQSSYASPMLTEFGGVRQIVVVNEDFVTAHDIADGRVLWEYPWPGNSGSNASASQPVPIGDDRLLLTKGYSVPAEVIEVGRDGGQWEAARVWQKPVLRTKMSNALIRDGFAYAISDIDLECVDLKNGRRKWKSRRRPEVGNGQIMLVGSQILVLSETGEVILAEASSRRYHELGSFAAIEGVTWNNPALSGPYLLVRNSEEAACYELPLQADSSLATLP